MGGGCGGRAVFEGEGVSIAWVPFSVVVSWSAGVGSGRDGALVRGVGGEGGTRGACVGVEILAAGFDTFLSRRGPARGVLVFAKRILMSNCWLFFHGKQRGLYFSSSGDDTASGLSAGSCSCYILNVAVAAVHLAVHPSPLPPSPVTTPILLLTGRFSR